MLLKLNIFSDSLLFSVVDHLGTHKILKRTVHDPKVWPLIQFIPMPITYL